MKWFKFTFIASLVILFIVTSFMAIFGSGRVLGQILKTYVFKYETCEYKYRPIAPVVKEPAVEPIQEEPPSKECSIDYNKARGDIADGLAMLIVSLPVAYFTQRQLRKDIKEVEK